MEKLNLLQVPTPPLSMWEAFQYCHDPRSLLFHMRHVRQRVEFVATLTGQSTEDALAAIHEVEFDTQFLEELLGKHLQYLRRKPRATDFMYLSPRAGSPYFFVVGEHAIARLLTPDMIVETGGTPGNSSAFLLRALAQNGKGQLVTIDLPPTTIADGLVDVEETGWHEVLPQGMTSGWAIPDRLRDKHRLVLGDARQVLPDVLAEAGSVDIFIHDSDHSYDHMSWEFEQAWPSIRPGGLLLSDDILANRAFDDFVQRHGASAHKLGNLGAIVKPPD